MNFQAAATAIATIYMARGRPLLWLDKLIDDTPVAIDAETLGAGDDIRLLLKDARTVEVQVKKGLKSGVELWDSLLKLAIGIASGAADFGVLVVSPTSSNTITVDLANDIVRIGDGRTDSLSDIGCIFLAKLSAAGVRACEACARLRIQVVWALVADNASILAARAELAHLCADEAQIGAAWNILYADAAALIEQRGRRDVTAVLRLLLAAGIKLAASTDAAPAQLLAKLAHWTLATHATFAIFGVDTLLSIDEAWIPLTAIVREESWAEYSSLDDALRRYQAWETRSAPRDARSVDPETLGRFVTRTVLVAGPGMGKTTLLKRIARRYSEDAIPVLRVRLSAVAARMQAGATFEEAVFHLGLDGSGITVTDAQHARFPNWTLLCDGLDECGALQEEVSAGVARFAAGYSDSRILVTTRPIGYRVAHFGDWRHYDVPALDTSAAHTNAARLIEAIATPDSKLHRDAREICRRELEDRPAARIVGRTPLLLSLAVAVIVRGGTLGATRERLFEQIFELIDEAPNVRVPEPPMPATLLRRFFDILGWHITSQPLAAIKNTLDRCAADLASDTGAKPLAAVADAERYLRYWQDVGMVERVGHGSQRTLAFIHKSFGEFAAARYLAALSPASQADAVAKRLDAPAWAEVLRFVGLMGLADVLAIQLVAGLDEGPAAKGMAFAAELVAEGNPPPNSELRGKIIGQSFAVTVGERRLQALEVGMQLVAAARRFPNEVGPIAARHLVAEQPWTRLIAWACAVTAGPEHYTLDALISILRQNVEAAGPGLKPSLGGGMLLARGDGHNLVEAFALDACEEIIDRAPAEVADALVSGIFNHENLSSVGFASKAMKLAHAKGRNYRIHSLEWSGRSLLDVPKGYFEAGRIMYYAIFDALSLPELSDVEDDPVPGVLLHLSALIEASQMNQVVASDIWAWSRPFDRDATRAALRGFIAVSGLDWDKLRADAMHARRYLNTEAADRDSFLFNIITNVDPPTIDWSRARTLGLDARLIEAAVAHPSQWMKWVGANLLSSLLDPDALEDAVRRLLDTGQKLTMWAACGLAADLDPDRTLALVLDRLAKPLVPGCGHLFALLTKLSPPWSSALETAIHTGLFANDVDTAASASKLAFEIAGPTVPELAPMLEQAHAHWLIHEEPYPTKGGVVPTSPRAKLINALRKIQPTSHATIKGYLCDPRPDVREIGVEALTERLRHSDDERLQFFSDVAVGDVSSSVLGKILKDGLPLGRGELAAAEALLTSERQSVRYSAMALLTDQYLSHDRIRSHARTLTHDSEQQIKDRAFAILDTR